MKKNVKITCTRKRVGKFALHADAEAKYQYYIINFKTVFTCKNTSAINMQF